VGEAPGTGDLGRRGFVERVKGRIRGAGSKREQPSVRRFESRDLKSVLKIVAGYFNLPQEKLVGRRTEWRDERAIAMELIYRYGGVSQPDVGKVMGDLDYTAVSRERKRLREKIKTERGLKAALDAIGISLMPKVKI
jgi:chromosomal replication initiation ATPase DnaA